MNTILTWLYVPGDRPDRFEKAVASGADAVVLDLEDAVVPERKQPARSAVAEFLRQPSELPLFVRVNDVRSPWCAADLEMLADRSLLSGVRIPKVESPDDIESVAERLGEHSTTRLHALLESALGVERAFAIATSSSRLASIGLGEADLRSDLGVTDDAGLAWARSRVVVAARAAGLAPPAMSVYPRLDDPEGLAASCRTGRALGFSGRSAIHPRQLPVILDAFVPGEEEVERARELLAAIGEATSHGSGVTVLADGRFVDRAMIASAQRVVDLAEAHG